MRDLASPFGRGARVHWGLDERLTFLNHGSFGAVPLELLERSAELRREIERNPIDGVWRGAMPQIRRVAEQCAAFVGAPPQSTGFVTNATAGINAVLGSIPLSPGDELLHLDHGYNAIWQTLKVIARRRGVVIRQVALPLPVSGAEQVVAITMAAVTPATKVLVLDQITSPSALRLPVADIVAAAAARGVEVVIDGAHSPGMLDQPAAEAPQAAAWTGNLHKWTCALRGCALLTVRPDLAAQIHAPIISHHLDEGLTAELDWQGTIDPTPWLLAAEAIAFMDRFGGWDAVRRHNHELATHMHAMLCERLGLTPLSPLDGSMLGSMATLRLPDSLQPQADDRGPEQLQAALLERFAIEIPVMEFAGVRYTRISCHVYNEAADYEHLATALEQLSQARA
ncbi:Isopenicillin N-epimerase [Enhygromyxa salina]|uniref:Isopenicillin N-epimerase n=1 Tax=Enhygromyxa salina TaxID=215803 RepID=A0A0C2D5F7_9BACT|nr:aminotransferase class V-fold PLP-dependent enzyme [Enhygromyxa salina]KIG18401.1 Isopenicillin N-epimerase [Enhygromyxa salina]